MPTVETTDTRAARIDPRRYDWHDASWRTLTQDLGRLPHALLLHGQGGLGKNEFALRLARFLLCRQREAHDGCGRCQGCSLFSAGNHPDLLRVGPLEDSKNILVDQVRGVIEFLSLRPHSAVYKIVIVSPAEAMNVNAANSLLKILEEPPAGTLLILVATHLSRVPVTLRSRCTRIAFGTPSTADALAWLRATARTEPPAEALLALAGGAPLAALALAQEGAAQTRLQLEGDLKALAQREIDPVACAERWKAIGPQACLDWLQRHVVETLRAQGLRSPSNSGKILSISIIDLFYFLDKVSLTRSQLGTGVDGTLMLENLLIRWCELTSK